VCSPIKLLWSYRACVVIAVMSEAKQSDEGQAIIVGRALLSRASQ
jgi:hypothetical protein